MLRLERLLVRCGGKVVLDLQDTEVEVKPGEVLALLGPNGAGKSSLLRAASGVLPLAAGRVTVDGDDLCHLALVERARRLGVVPQAASVPAAFTAIETVLLGRTARLGWLGRETPEDRNTAREMLGRVGIAALADRALGALSGGERQLVLVARALAQEPKYLLLDEPTAHLDLRHEAAILSLVRGLACQGGLGVIVALHDLSLAGRYAHRAVLLDRGRLVASGPPTEVLVPGLLSKVYEAPVRVFNDPETGAPVIAPGLPSPESSRG